MAGAGVGWGSGKLPLQPFGISEYLVCCEWGSRWARRQLPDPRGPCSHFLLLSDQPTSSLRAGAVTCSLVKLQDPA